MSQTGSRESAAKNRSVSEYEGTRQKDGCLCSALRDLLLPDRKKQTASGHTGQRTVCFLRMPDAGCGLDFHPVSDTMAKPAGQVRQTVRWPVQACRVRGLVWKSALFLGQSRLQACRILSAMQAAERPYSSISLAAEPL